MSRESRERVALPAERAFVVWLRGDCRPAEQDYRGRVEHVRSGDLAHFESLAELLAFLARVTGADGAPP
jgi:hypothetical protein